MTRPPTPPNSKRFYLWRYTKEPRWRDYGWAMFLALQRHCRVRGRHGGYSGIRDVTAKHPIQDDLMQVLTFDVVRDCVLSVFEVGYILTTDIFDWGVVQHLHADSGLVYTVVLL